MKNIYLNIYKPNFRNLKRAKKIIDNNNVIGLPTETVYGLAGNAYSNKAVKKIFKLKKRSPINPLIIHYKKLEDIKNDAIYDSSMIKLYKAFCPGPITFILKKKSKSNLSKIATAGKKTVAIRFPNHRVAQNILKIINKPLAAPSANISTKVSSTSARDVFDEFGKKIKIILDGGKCKIGLESTIIDLTGKPCILRPGEITKEKIEKILSKKIKIRKSFKKINAPGQLKLHYSPGIPVEMNKKNVSKQQALIGFGKKFKIGKNYFNLRKKPNNKQPAVKYQGNAGCSKAKPDSAANLPPVEAIK